MSQNPSDPTRPEGQAPQGGSPSPQPGPQSPQGYATPQPGYQTPQQGYATPQQGYQSPQQGSYPPPQSGQPGSALSGDERTMMLIAHLSAPVSMLVSVGWLPFLGPLLVWLFYKDRSHAVRTVSAGAFNFNASLTIVSVLTWISVFITLFIGLIWAIPIWIALFVIQVWVHVKGAILASRDEVYEYPFQLRILS